MHCNRNWVNSTASMKVLLKLAHLRWAGHVTRTSDEGLPKKVFYRNCRKESTHKVVKRNTTKTPLNESWKQLHSIEQSGIASSTKEPQSLNQRESVKLKESVDGKQEPRGHHLTRHSLNSHALFATNS